MFGSIDLGAEFQDQTRAPPPPPPHQQQQKKQSRRKSIPYDGSDLQGIHYHSGGDPQAPIQYQVHPQSGHQSMAMGNMQWGPQQSQQGLPQQQHCTRTGST